MQKSVANLLYFEVMPLNNPTATQIPSVLYPQFDSKMFEPDYIPLYQSGIPFIAFYAAIKSHLQARNSSQFLLVNKHPLKTQSSRDHVLTTHRLFSRKPS